MKHFVKVMAIGVMVLALLTGCSKTTSVDPVVETAKAEESVQESSAAAAEKEESSQAAESAAVEESKEESSQAAEASETAAESSQAAEASEASEVSEASEASEVSEEPVPDPVIGKQTGTETEVVVALKNGTEWGITGMEVVSPDGSEWTGQMLSEGDVFAAGETRNLYFDPQAAGGNIDYNIILTFDDGTQGKLHAFPFDNTQEATILYSSLPYIEFLSLNSGNIVSTEPQELAVGWSNAGSDWGGDGGADPNAGCIGDAPTN